MSLTENLFSLFYYLDVLNIVYDICGLNVHILTLQLLILTDMIFGLFI